MIQSFQNCISRSVTRCKWFRDLIMWKYAIDYLHHDVVKTAELSSDRNYLIAACPHGIIS